jgi:hypothetical protein
LHLNQGMCVLLGCFSSSDTYILIGVWFWWRRSKDKHHKETCLKEIGLRL